MSTSWKFINMLLACAALSLAGCATQLTRDWGFRYDDRDKITEAASKIEAVAALTQQLAMRPEHYVGTQNQFAASTYNSAAVDTIRLFAAEAARFHRAVRAWKPGGDINVPYSNLTDKWTKMKEGAGRFMASADIRTKLERINELMTDLGRMTNTGAGLSRAARSGVAEPVVPSSEQKTRLFSEPQPKQNAPALQLRQ
jgi:outer membrane murein-binding lipoprotein Lpp